MGKPILGFEITTFFLPNTKNGLPYIVLLNRTAREVIERQRGKHPGLFSHTMVTQRVVCITQRGNPIVYLYCIVLKVRQDKRVINKSIYLALGINLDGHKKLLELWIAETEGAKFWLSILTGLKNRGLEQILIACVDGLSGFPKAIEAV